MEQDQATCGAIHISPTASGDLLVACGKKPDHVDAGDRTHEGRVGVFPVRWTDGN